jgi:hypothetical protein
VENKAVFTKGGKQFVNYLMKLIFIKAVLEVKSFGDGLKATHGLPHYL